eukprot:Protomagalhaensia_sp_Gyna_25__5127@NODE_596_length_3044_cov_394_092180_g462_i0_p2_GENE_NODE_596_length_3044_cov_394_092180_g462_i0NODE_596_length_3044_cov_394_092180_g462_i0_p2_ORF_typecomplete_len255_score37_68Proteasome/PF00227_26/2_2e35_NODE_596_length_3044_cov_394_092180_g462_i033767
MMTTAMTSTPHAFSLRQHSSSTNSDGREPPISLGTVLLGLKYAGGVLLASDSRTSAGTVTDPSAHKINKLADNIYVCRSGTASHSQFLVRTMRHYLSQAQVEACATDLPPVKAAASIARLIQYHNRGTLSTGIFVGGYDKKKGPQLYQLPPGGAVMDVDYAVAGSGGIYIKSLVDSLYRNNMSFTETKQLAIKLITNAIHSCQSCGGCIWWIAIEDSGVQEGVVGPHDIPTEEQYLTELHTRNI